MTGARGVLGTALMTRLDARDRVPIDRHDGAEIADRVAMRELLSGCEVLVHLAAIHPLVAAADTDYVAANVTPFAALLDVARAVGVERIVFASSTSVWSDAAEGMPCRFIDESTRPDGIGEYARSKLVCEALLGASGFHSVVFRLARFAQESDPADTVRLLYRAVRPAAAADAIVRAIDDARAEGLFALSAPTPFRPEDADRLARDPRSVIRERTGSEPAWVPDRIGSVILSGRAQRELGWGSESRSASRRDE